MLFLLIYLFKMVSIFRPLVSTCNITAQHVVAGYGLLSLNSTVKALGVRSIQLRSC